MTPTRKLTDNINLLNFKFTDTMQSLLYLIHDQNEAALIDAHIGTMAEEVLNTARAHTHSLIPIPLKDGSSLYRDLRGFSPVMGWGDFNQQLGRASRITCIE